MPDYGKAALGDLNKKVKWVTPEMFGAIGDGVNNDTDAIKKASDTGKEVRFDGKTYLVKVPSNNTYFAIEANGNCPKFRGVRGKTIIKLELDNSVDESTNSKSGILVAWNTEIQGITFDGGYNPANTKANLSSVVTVGANSRVRGCDFKNARGSNIGVTGSNVKVHHNKFDTFGDHAVYIHQEYQNTRINDIDVYDNAMTEDPSYQNGVQGGTIRGVVKIRDNVENVNVYNNKITGDQCVLVSANAVAQSGIATKISIYQNDLFTTYSGVHLDTDLTTDNGFRLTKDDVDIFKNNMYMTATANVIGVALEYSSATITSNEFISVDAANTNTGINEFGTGDTGKSIITENTFRKVRIGIFKPGSGTLIKRNKFYDITATGGTGIYSQYADRIIDNDFYSCIEGLRIVGARTTKKAVYDRNNFYDCTTGVLQKNGSSGYSFTRNYFYDCVTDSVLLESASGFRAENNFGNVVVSGPSLPELVSSSTVVHSPFINKPRTATTIPGAIQDFYGAEIIIKDATTGDKVLRCLRDASGNYYWKEL